MLGPEILKPKKVSHPQTSFAGALAAGIRRGKDYREIESIKNIYEVLSAKHDGTEVIPNEELKKENPDINWEGEHTAASRDIVIRKHEEETKRNLILENTSGWFSKYIVSGAGTMASAMADPLGIALMAVGGKFTSRLAFKGVEKLATFIPKALSEKAITSVAQKLVGHTASNMLGAAVGETAVLASEDQLERDYTVTQAVAGVAFGSVVFAGGGMVVGGMKPALARGMQRIKEVGGEYYGSIMNVARRADATGKNAEKVLGPVIEHIDESIKFGTPVDDAWVKSHVDKSMKDPAMDVDYNPKAEKKLAEPPKKYDNATLGEEANAAAYKRKEELSKVYAEDPEYKKMVEADTAEAEHIKRVEAMADCRGMGGF